MAGGEIDVSESARFIYLDICALNRPFDDQDQNWRCSASLAPRLTLTQGKFVSEFSTFFNRALA